MIDEIFGLKAMNNLDAASKTIQESLRPAKNMRIQLDALMGNSMRGAFEATKDFRELARSFQGAAEAMKLSHAATRLDLFQDFSHLASGAAAQMDLHRETLTNAKMQIGSALAQLKEGALLAGELATHARQFQELRHQWMLPSALQETFSAIRAAQELIRLNLPVVDFASAAAISEAWGREGVDRQLRALGIEDDLDSETIANNPASYRAGGLGLPDFWTSISLLLAILMFLYQQMDSAQTDSRFSGYVDKLSHSQQQEMRRLESIEEHLRMLLTQDRGHVDSTGPLFVTRRRPAAIRSSYSPRASHIAIAFPNQVVTLVGEHGKWIHIRYYDWLVQETRDGWALKKYFQRVPDASSNPMSKYFVGARS